MIMSTRQHDFSEAKFSRATRSCTQPVYSTLCISECSGLSTTVEHDGLMRKSTEGKELRQGIRSLITQLFGLSAGKQATHHIADGDARITSSLLNHVDIVTPKGLAASTTSSSSFQSTIVSSQQMQNNQLLPMG